MHGIAQLKTVMQETDQRVSALKLARKQATKLLVEIEKQLG